MIKSGIAEVDNFLNGGFEGGFITDIYGSAASGKSQIVFQICANAIMNNSSVLFQDTKGEFRPERILEILKANNKDEKLLDNISVLRITNTKEQISNISKIKPNFSLVIIDNVTELFSFEYNKEELAITKNKIFMKYMHDLSQTALTYNIPIIVTNMVRTSSDLEVENLSNAINPFTHLKIHLQRNGNHLDGELTSLNKKSRFSFIISNEGIKNSS